MVALIEIISGLSDRQFKELKRLIMSQASEIQAALDRVNAVFDGIRADIQKLKEIQDTLTLEAKALLDSLGSRLEALDAENT